MEDRNKKHSQGSEFFNRKQERSNWKKYGRSKQKNMEDISKEDLQREKIEEMLNVSFM